MPVPTIRWEDGRVIIIDQTRLPLEEVYIPIENIHQMWEAIKKLRIRGAPAIGIAGAFGVYLGIKDYFGKDLDGFLEAFEQSCRYIESSRPTAVNLFWATAELRKTVKDTEEKKTEKLKEIILKRCIRMIDEDNEVCLTIGKNGEKLIKDGYTLLTHCNAGGLATAMYGTALSPMFLARQNGKNIHVYVDETRPLLQGARITTWELLHAGIKTTLITDNMAATVLKNKNVDMIIVGADRIAMNGDTANKIGTLMLGVLAKEFGVPLYVAAPISTFDPEAETGDDIPIEERDREEVIHFGERQTAPDDVDVYNPAFDVTPAEYITGIITERGIISKPFEDNIQKTLSESTR